MKKIGLVGGIGSASTVSYYLGLIEKFRKELGETVYPEIVIDSVNMQIATDYIFSGDLKRSAELMLKSLSNLKAAGAEVGAITANTEHIAWNEMKDRFEIPVISIVDAAVSEILKRGFKRVLVLGTVFTMKSRLYENALISKDITPILPSEKDKEMIGGLIFPNLENGVIIQQDREKMLAAAEKYISDCKADSVLLGCTELPLIFKDGDLSVPVLNTTAIHINAVFEYAKY